MSTSGESGDERFGANGASKAAVRAYARTWANELAGRGVRADAVSLGPADTPLLEVFGGRAAEMKAAVGAGLPVERIGIPEDVAHTVDHRGEVGLESPLPRLHEDVATFEK